MKGSQSTQASVDSTAQNGAGIRPVARIDDLHVSFDRAGATVRALRGVSFELAPGEIFGIVGESGSGKTVLGLTMLGLLVGTPTPSVSGSAWICGTDMARSSDAERREVRRRHLGAVFQDPMTSLNPTMRVERQLVEACGDRAEAVRLLEAVGVPEPTRRLRSFPHELSGGLRQRVMIAMAIAGRPKLVVADEPTTALDVTVQAQILELIRQLSNRFGTTFVLITHDLGVAAQISERIGVLYGGRIAEIGPTAEVLRSPQHPYTVGLLRSRLTMSSPRGRQLPALDGEPPDPRAHPPGCPFAPRCPYHAEECDVALPRPVAVAGQPGRASACLRLERLGGSWEGRWPTAGPVVSVAETSSWPPEASPEPVAERPPCLALELARVRKSFRVTVNRYHKGRLQALRGVDLEVRPGESVALVGESGCGKSTLLRIAAGLVSADEGTVRRAPGDHPQMVFQDAGASLTPWLTVGQLVGERLRHIEPDRATRRRRLLDALKLVGLTEEVISAKAGQLSGGQRQRVCMARAVVVPPALLLCDEPTSALDVSLVATVLNLLSRLRSELGMAMLFVTHDLTVARVVADRVAVMYLGEIVEDGPTDIVTSDPQHPYTRALLSSVPGAGVRRALVRGEPASPLDPPVGCAFRPRCSEAEERCGVESPVLLLDAGEVRCVACWRRQSHQVLPVP